MDRFMPTAIAESYGLGQIDDRDRNIITAKEALREFERIAENGGTIELEIDRYGHLKMKVVVNPKSP